MLKYFIIWNGGSAFDVLYENYWLISALEFF
jgi:hypothetical protein